MDAIEAAKLHLLVVKCQLGDKAALEELFHRYNPALKYYLRRLLERDEVGDALQDVWVLVIRRLCSLRSPQAITVWIYRIARSKALDHLARRGPPAGVEQTSAGEEIIDDREPELSADEAAAVHSALARLPAEQREALTLRFLEDLSYEEIAVVTGCAVGTVRSRLHYAKAAMRQFIGEIS